MRRDGDVPGALHDAEGSDPRADGRDNDLLFDYSGVGSIDVPGLSLLITARLLAGRGDRQVWVRGLPFAAWRFLQALGIDHLFRLFPVSVEPVD